MIVLFESPLSFALEEVDGLLHHLARTLIGVGALVSLRIE
jgi:hypothetical protein